MLGRAGVIYADTGLSQAVLATPGEGTQVRLLGRTSLYHHVQAGDAIGYVPLSGLDLDAETERHIAAQQLTGYMEVQPGWEARYTAYQLERKHLYSQYGAVEGWTLAQNAEDSQLAQRYGFEWLTDRDGHRIIHVLPDADDLVLAVAVHLGHDRHHLRGADVEAYQQIPVLSRHGRLANSLLPRSLRSLLSFVSGPSTPGARTAKPFG